jgi:hypothetical protein
MSRFAASVNLDNASIFVLSVLGFFSSVHLASALAYGISTGRYTSLMGLSNGKLEAQFSAASCPSDFTFREPTCLYMVMNAWREPFSAEAGTPGSGHADVLYKMYCSSAT